MAREESRSRIIEDGTTGANATVHSDGSIQSRIYGENGNVVEPNSNGSLPVTTVVTPPPASTPIIKSNFQDTSVTAGIDTEYVITSGKVLKITNFDAGAEFNSAGSVVELFEDPNGDKTILNRISEIFLNASSAEKGIDQNFTGDGTRRIVLRLRAYGGGVREISGRWRGYEE